MLQFISIMNPVDIRPRKNRSSLTLRVERRILSPPELGPDEWAPPGWQDHPDSWDAARDHYAGGESRAASVDCGRNQSVGTALRSCLTCKGEHHKSLGDPVCQYRQQPADL